MENKLYKLCLEQVNDYNNVNPFWGNMAKKYGYPSKEALRSAFRRERARRGDVKGVDARNFPKVYLFDIETLPMRSYHWNVWQENINANQIIDDWCMLSWSAKPLFGSEIVGDILSPDEALKRNDERIVASLWKLFNTAHILIAHNGDNFDIPRANTRFLYYRMHPPSPFRSVDTLKIIKYNFSLTMNNLGYVGKFLKLEHLKMKTDGFELWKGCAEGDKNSLKNMWIYNQGDVVGLEDLYMEVRAWDKRHPNIGLYFDNAGNRCSICGCTELRPTDKYYYGTTRKYGTVRCTTCGALGRTVTNLIPKYDAKDIVQPLAK